MLFYKFVSIIEQTNEIYWRPFDFYAKLAVATETSSIFIQVFERPVKLSETQKRKIKYVSQTGIDFICLWIL